MGRAKKNMMKRLSIEELVDTYLNSDGETEKAARSEIENRYWEEYEVRKEILLKLIAYENEKSWRLVICLPLYNIYDNDYIEVFKAMAEADFLTWVKRIKCHWAFLGEEAKRLPVVWETVISRLIKRSQGKFLIILLNTIPQNEEVCVCPSMIAMFTRWLKMSIPV